MTALNLKRIKAVAWKEFIQVKRDPRSLGLAIVIPIFMLLLFGYGLSLDIDHVRTLVWNQDASSRLTNDFLLNFKNSKYFKIVGYTDNYADITRKIDKGQILMALIIPKDFSHYIESDKTAPLQLIVDGSDANTALIALGYVRSVVSKYNVDLLTEAFAKHGENPPKTVSAHPRIWFNMGLVSTWFIIPGVIAMIIMIISALLISITIAREWERGTMEQLISTPVKGPELIIGKLMPYFIIAFFDLMVGVLMARFLFGVPFRGNYFLFIVLSSLFLIGALSQGILISVNSKTQLMATQLASLTTLIPTLLLSGFIYPIFNMPKFIQAFTYFVPARYYIVVLRDLFLKGNGIATLWDEALFLLLFAVVMFNLAIIKFKKKVA
ncbi:MAG: ABC transporter permease [Candidatus Omnitrophica bacterium]|jgi:ABC-2 type transport system permease protein|nr:ABC transporter permease [Candidatus Omnitrophota bacterium]MDD5660273.1 ABC transporter permease [Candidatus Omnitrophota bacterium]